MVKAPRLSNDCFALPTGVHWTPVDEALSLLKSRLTVQTPVVELALADALGLCLAEDVTAKRSHPPTANSAVDGYAFAGGVGDGEHRLTLLPGRAAAGVPFDGTIGHLQAVRILTGAPMPIGADTVVLQEDVALDGGFLRLNGPLKQGANSRAAGEDVVGGDVILAKGHRLQPQDLGLLAAVGLGMVKVHRRLKVAVISTGDELQQAGNTAQDAQIYDANRPMLLAMIATWGFTPVDIGIIPDDRAEVRAALDDAANHADVILTSGGASAGDEDHISALLNEARAMSLWRIAIKPGRPLGLGVWAGVPVFGLPGNPVAAFTCTMVFARPAMLQLSGGRFETPVGQTVPASFVKRKKTGRREFLRARLRGGVAEVFASEGSGRVSGLSWAEGFLELPDGALDVSYDTPVRYIPFSEYGL